MTREGKTIPLSVSWDDGRNFPIDKILHSGIHMPETGGVPVMRYTCMISGQLRYLYQEPKGYTHMETIFGGQIIERTDPGFAWFVETENTAAE